MIAPNQIIHADAVGGLKTIPDGVVNTCITSPPYYRLRDYGVDGQIGLEDTPEAYIERLVTVFREVKRVLRDDGTLWVVINDSYNGSGKGGGNKNTAVCTKPTSLASMKPKDMIGIPWMLAFALRDDGWYLRNDIIWQKPNAMPESVCDRCTNSYEHIFLLSKSKTYYFDNESIKEPASSYGDDKYNGDIRYGGKKYTADPTVFNRTKSGKMYHKREKRNKRDVWTVATTPYSKAHFATFPIELIRPCILAGCPVGGIVLDPFIGSGTTAAVAKMLGRNYIGIELNLEYIKLANERINGVTT